MATKNDIVTEIPAEEQKQEEIRVRVILPLNSMDESGLKIDQYEHVTVNGNTTLIKRGEYVDVTVPVYLQLRNKFKNI